MVRSLAPYLAEKGWDVTVYGRPGAVRLDDPSAHPRVITRVTAGLETQSLSTLSYGLTSTVDSTFRRPDVALVMNVANGYFLPILRARGIPTLVNVDGIEWERAKWSRLAKRVFHRGALFTARWADGLIFDAQAVERYWHREFGKCGTFIPYGGDPPPELPTPAGLTHRGYVLMVARFVPENSLDEFFQAVPRIATRWPVIIVGSSGYGGHWDEAAARLEANYPLVSWLGHVSDDSLLHSLWQHAGVYFHGHTVGGTNPALVQAMASGAPIIARDSVYNMEVLGSTGTYVTADPESIVDAIWRLMDDASELHKASTANARRAAEYYSWKTVCSDYEILFHDLLGRSRDGR